MDRRRKATNALTLQHARSLDRKEATLYIGSGVLLLIVIIILLILIF
jgi:hypothetical protein